MYSWYNKINISISSYTYESYHKLVYHNLIMHTVYQVSYGGNQLQELFVESSSPFHCYYITQTITISTFMMSGYDQNFNDFFLILCSLSIQRHTCFIHFILLNYQVSVAFRN